MGKAKLISLVGESTNPNAVKNDPTGLGIFLGDWGNSEVPWDAQPDYKAVKEVYQGLGNDSGQADFYAFKVLGSGLDVAKSEGVDFKADLQRYLARVPDSIEPSGVMQTASGQPLTGGSFWNKNKGWLVPTLVVIGVCVVAYFGYKMFSKKKAKA